MSRKVVAFLFILCLPTYQIIEKVFQLITYINSKCIHHFIIYFPIGIIVDDWSKLCCCYVCQI
uniref:Putative salivary secreted peptide n=1 Tax=Glossina morsitans morsitans TaxID=37546 RepID=D3TQF7_GLOMM